MFKSKIFNSVMRYMLVAMLALLPNAIWGENYTNNIFLTDVNRVSIDMQSILGGSDKYAKYNYIEFYFLDKSDAIVDLSNIKLGLWNSESNDANPDFNGDGFKKTKNYYLFYKEKNGWGCENLFRFKINTTNVDLSGYKFVVKASNTNNFETDKTTADVTYTYQLYSQSDVDAVTFTKATAPTLVKSAYALKEGNKCIFSGASIYDEIKSILGVSSKEDIKDFYIRWTIKHTDGTKVDKLTVSSEKIQKRNDVDYIYFNNTGSSIQAKDLDVTLELPSSESWDNIKLSFVISKNISELTTKYGVVEKEPTLDALYNITLETKYSMPFKHYVGHANTALDNGMQQTAEWEYYVYVKEASEEIELVLPFDEYENSGKDLEPQGYFRWYDLKTDLASNNLRQNSGTKPTLLNPIISGGKNYGLFAYNLQKADKPCSDNIGVTYTAPAEASSEGWAGEDIACDVSRYIDGLDATKTYLVHEPTLSIRYIFHIRSAKKLADDIMNTAIGKNLERAGYRTYEDGKYITVGMKDKSSSIVTLRLDLSDAKKYYFHPLADDIYKKNGSSEGFTNRVYYVDEKDKLVESNFDKNKLCKATKIEWWAYDKTKTYCRNLGTTDKRFFKLTMENLGKLPWASVSMDGSSKSFTFEYGDPVFIVAYAMDEENHRCPIANFDVRFMNNHPMTKDEIIEAGLNNRLISYLDEHYKMATKPITFDDDDVEQTVSAPTSPDDNQDRLPSKWDRRAYSFVYRDLIDCDASWWVNLGEIGHSPLHGDYCLYKSANVNGISGNGETLKDGYLWWQSGQLYDKTYEITNGSQYGHFLYVDASDESRKIAAADFTADLCTGQQLIFTAGVADMTKADTKPQIMFKLFGVKRNVNDDIVEKHLIHSFASGDFKTNVEKLKPATWYQVYGKITLQKESNVEQYSDFRLEIDNYCSNTDGADYAVDDIRMYLAPAKVQVIQEKPVCNGATTGTIKLKIRAIHETLNAILGHKDTKIYFRFVGEDGKPVTGDGFYSYTLTDKKNGTKNNVSGSEYGTVNVYDSEEKCKNFEIDGTNMIEQDSEGETYIVISNKDFPLTTGKKYYVSVSTEDPAKGNANWGTPAEVCSLYSNWFEMVSQHPIITDVKGNVVTDYKIPCDQADNYEVKIKGQLTTTDPYNGGKITLDGVKFIWYIDGTGETNKVDPSAPASNEIIISKDKLTLGTTHHIYMKPEGTQNSVDYIEYTAPNGKTYLLCTSAIPVPLRVMKDGPQLNFGFNDVDYPFNDGSYEASLRIGLPQLEKLKASKGYLKVPLHSATMRDGTAITEPLTFIDDSKAPAIKSKSVIVASTNDPLWEKKLNQTVATLENEELPAFNKTTQATLNLKFEDNAVANFHEGYYYVLRFAYEKRAASAGTTNCPGESYLKLKIVPEFITWTPTADGGMNANWNNDANWHRSSSTELYDDDYTDYQTYGSSTSAAASASKIEIPTLNSYVPMKFTKVTIGNLNGLPFPDLGNIVYRSTNQIATKLTNGKGNEATKYIQYDFMAIWNEADANKGFGTDGNLKCEKFYGNTCHQIYFKPQGELRDQCYLVYDKAWVEKELEPNKWYTMASPLQYIYAGDMYVPAKDGRQETKAFTDITFDDKVAGTSTAAYSRSKYPVYQRAWMKSDVKEITPKSDYPASHYPSVAAPENVDMNLGYWSHVYNKVDESYAADGTFGGFSIKAGNALLPKDKTKKALLRLPKADKEYQYFDYKGNENSSSKTSVTKDPKGRGKLLVAFNNDERHLAEKTQSLGTDNNSGFYLVANPYTCSISLKKFFEANTGLQNAIWIVENDEVKAISSTENYAIQPTQSFFVKKKDGKTVENVRFTSAMYVDRTITPGLLMASDYVKSIEATTENSKGQISKARIALRPEASADYDDQEDVDLLYDQNLKDVPQVYTVAGNEAVAVNAVPELSWIPLGIVSQQAEEVSLTLKGVNKLDAPVYLYDAASASFTEVHDGEAVKVKADDHGRYFLTQTRTSTGIDRMETEEQSAPVKVYSPAAGMIVVSALGSEKLDRVQVFTLDGKMVHSYQLPAKQRMILRVPSGIYIVKASTQSCAQAKGQKISVR
jgi:hypothetical protein